MSLFVDVQFADKLGFLVRNFKRKANHLYSFSCPLCGDSKRRKLKTRGYLFRWKDGLRFKCHNCGESLPFYELLKLLDQGVFKEYQLECFKQKRDDERTPAPSKAEAAKPKSQTPYKPIRPSVLAGYPSIASLPNEHPARQYLEARKLPARFLKRIYWADDFSLLASQVCSGQSELVKEGRIVIPFLDRDHNLLAIQGRSLDPNATVRYITIKAFEDAPRIYGLDRLGLVWKRIYIVEGPFDSMFLPNCLAMAGSDIPASLPRDAVVIAYDNEPLNQEIRAKIEKAIDQGYRVVVWPEEMREKDINEMVLAGYTAESIRKMIDIHSYVGLKAKEMLRAWKTPHRKPNSTPQKGHA